ncbi:MAG: DUF4384 domain-containing protein [Thermodesulfobacteriota bacterium]
MKTIVNPWPVSLAVAALILGSVACPTGWASDRDDIVAQFNSLKSTNPEFRIDLWTTSTKQAFNVNDKLELSFKADRDCYVYIIDIPTGGEAPTVLFPNEWDRSNKVEAGKTYTLPFQGSEYKLSITGPAGTETIKAIATVDPLPEFDSQVGKQLAAKAGFARLKDARLVRKAITVELKEDVGPQQERRVWTETSLSFQVH